MRKTTALDSFLEDIDDLKEAKEILSRIWSEICIDHRKFKLSSELNNHLERYFNFDDSE